MLELLNLNKSLFKSFLNHQFTLFVIIGIFNTIFGYSIYALFIYIGCHYTLACLLTTCACIPFNFKTTGKIVFKSSVNNAFPRFIAINIFNYFLGIALIKSLTFLSENIYLDGLIATIIVALCTYLLNKYFVFREMTYETH